MSVKNTRWLIYSLGIFCLIIFLAVRIQPLFNALLLEKYIPEYWENTKWGELYYLNHIKHFQEKDLPECRIKYRFTEKHPKLEDAEILAFGDSYFDFSRMVTFPEKLADKTHNKVFYSRDKEPLNYLNDNGYIGNERKFIIYETAERFLPGRFNERHKIIQQPAQNDSKIKQILHAIRLFIFPYNSEKNYSMLLSRSYITTHIYSSIATLKFDLFKQINSQTPVYYLGKERPWLFGGGWYGDGPSRYSYEDSPEEIDTYCDNIAYLSKDLKEKYNLEMVFMIIPSKYTIYHHLLGVPDSSYGNFIPKMYAGLEKRGIPVIKVYDHFMEKRDEKLLYYGTDTHWTEEGLNIALNQTLLVLDSLRFSNYQAISETPVFQKNLKYQ